MSDQFDEMSKSVEKMPKPFGISQSQWDELQGSIAALEKFKLDIEARVLALEKPAAPVLGDA